MGIFSGRRAPRRASFWLLGGDRLSVCVLRRQRDEPFLERCAGWRAAPIEGTLFAPGLLELALATDALELPAVAALGREFAALVATAADEDRPDEGRRLVGCIAGHADVRVEADLRAVEAAWSLFRSAGLDLRELDAEVCGLLADFLGHAEEEADTSFGPRDVLAAVSLEPAIEEGAARLSDLLAGPVGLALARWPGDGRAH